MRRKGTLQPKTPITLLLILNFRGDKATILEEKAVRATTQADRAMVDRATILVDKEGVAKDIIQVDKERVDRDTILEDKEKVGRGTIQVDKATIQEDKGMVGRAIIQEDRAFTLMHSEGRDTIQGYREQR